jgi:hypothetical protein
LFATSEFYALVEAAMDKDNNLTLSAAIDMMAKKCPYLLDNAISRANGLDYPGAIVDKF